jgi:hypothetical protein
MIARPPNCISVPNQMNGTRFQPNCERCWSELKPTTARAGARINGSEIITETTQACRCSSTIITRFSVPTISAAAMPTVSWNRDKRSRRGQGSSGVATAANGSRSNLNPLHIRLGARIENFILPAPELERCKTCYPPDGCG